MYNVIVFLCILTASYKQLQNTGSYPGYFVQGGSEDAIFIYVNGLDLPVSLQALGGIGKYCPANAPPSPSHPTTAGGGTLTGDT